MILNSAIKLILLRRKIYVSSIINLENNKKTT